MRIGATFKIIGDDDQHLHLVISAPCPKTQSVVSVNFTGWQHGFDQTCIVQVGEHPYIAKRSLVFYPNPRMYKLSTLDKLNKYGLLEFHEDLSDELLKRIQVGALKSPYMPITPKQIMREQFGHLLT